MPKRMSVLAGAALAAVALAVVFTGGGSAQGGATTITVVQRNGGFRFLDNPPTTAPRVTTGDQFVARSPLFKAEQRVGTLHAECTATRGAASFEGATFHCTGEFVLWNGRLSVDSVFKGSETTARLIVTGGRGAYFGRDGAGTSTSQGDGTSVDVLTLAP